MMKDLVLMEKDEGVGKLWEEKRLWRRVLVRGLVMEKIEGGLRLIKEVIIIIMDEERG